MARTGQKGELPTFMVVPLSVPVGDENSHRIVEFKFDSRDRTTTVTVESPSFPHIQFRIRVNTPSDFGPWWNSKNRNSELKFPEKIEQESAHYTYCIVSKYTTSVFWDHTSTYNLGKMLSSAFVKEELKIANRIAGQIFENINRREFSDMETSGKMFKSMVLDHFKMDHKWISQTRILLDKKGSSKFYSFDDYNKALMMFGKIHMSAELYTDDWIAATFTSPIHIAMSCDYDTFIQMTAEEKSKVGLP